MTVAGAYGVIFDMDGVLVDSYRPHLISTQETCRSRGVEMSDAQFNALFGQSFASFAKAVFGDALTPEQVNEWYWEKEDLYRQMIREDFPAMDGAAELIAALGSADFRLAIGSSGPKENVACIVENLPNGQLFHATVNGDEVKRGKPAPDVFLKAAEKLGLDPSRCAVVEDSLHGIRAAKTAGMRAIGITGTAPFEELAAEADLAIRSLRELSPAAFAKLLGVALT